MMQELPVPTGGNTKSSTLLEDIGRKQDFTAESLTLPAKHVARSIFNAILPEIHSYTPSTQAEVLLDLALWLLTEVTKTVPTIAEVVARESINEEYRDITASPESMRVLTTVLTNIPAGNVSAFFFDEDLAAAE